MKSSGNLRVWLSRFYLSTPKFDFVRFALVVQDKPRNSLYIHGLNTGKTDKENEETKFIRIFLLTHILTGTLVSRSICLSIPEDQKRNIYPMAQWCSASFGKVAYSQIPAAIHTYGNEVYWGADVDHDSVGVQGSQSANDLVSSLNFIQNAASNLELQKQIHFAFSNNTYRSALENLNFKLSVGRRQILFQYVFRNVYSVIHRLKSSKFLSKFV